MRPLLSGVTTSTSLTNCLKMSWCLLFHLFSLLRAVRFENETGVDALAIAIGNAHGNYKSTPKLRFDILEQVEKNTELPLVLHGGTGITPDDFVRCSHTGIKKINIATATFDSVEHTVKDAYKNDKISGYYDLQAAEVEGAYQNAKRHILIFGTDNKA